MSKHYHHLTYEQRCQIFTLKQRGDSNSLIAELLNVDRSTIYRELIRNKGRKGYCFNQAHHNYSTRRKKTKKARKMTPELISKITEKLNIQWSPEQISGWLKMKKYLNAVSHETIYQYIWKDKKLGGSLYKNLRHRGKLYNKRSKNSNGRGCIPNRISIDKRPDIVEKKIRIGDWELDTIIGKNHNGAIVSMVDRASKFTKLVLVKTKTSNEVEQAIVSALWPFRNYVFTLTADNGKEFSKHQKISTFLKTDFFFATPYHSWERGLNEHTNGLVRQYFPKSTDFTNVTQEQVDEVQVVQHCFCKFKARESKYLS